MSHVSHRSDLIFVRLLHRCYLETCISVVAQAYEAEVGNEYVIKGNAAILKCGIPSFVADFVHVTGWLEETTGANYLLQLLGTEN